MAIKIDIKAKLESKEHKSTIGEKSLKSLRTYQLGVVYRDKYGREAPVITNEDASFTVEKNISDYKNSIITSIESSTPSWADSYKYFIKETSNEYYNACMDRWYDAEDENLWLSFPSADRNKIQEDTFIILKKKADTAEAVHEEGKYKVIDIQNEAPDFVKTDYESYGEQSLTIEANGALPGGTVIIVDATSWESSLFYDALIAGHTDGNNETATGSTDTGFIGWPLENVVVKLSQAGGRTKWLDVSSIYKSTHYFIKLSKAFEGTTDTTTNPQGSPATGSIATLLPDGSGTITVKLAKKVVKKKPEFDGHFFVKVRRDNIIDTYIRDLGNMSPSFDITHESGPVYYKSGSQAAGEDYEGWWKSFGEHFFIDNVRRRSVGGERYVSGTGGPYIEDDGYGINGNRPNPHGKPTGPYTMDLGYQNILDPGDGFSTENNTPSKVEFFKKMSEPGTMFRWKEDPFQIVYIVDHGMNTIDNSDPNGRGIWNYSNGSYDEDESHNKCHRAYIRFKTTGWRLAEDQYTQANNSPVTTGTLVSTAIAAQEKDLYPFRYGSINRISQAFHNGSNGQPAVPLVSGLPRWDPRYRGYGTYGGSVSGNQIVSGGGAWISIKQTPVESGTFSHGSTPGYNTIQIVSLDTGDADPVFSKNPAIWETEPKEDKGLDIYYEASQAYPLNLNNKTNELFAPYGCTVVCDDTLPDNTSVYLPSATSGNITASGVIDITPSLANVITLDTANTLIQTGMIVQGVGLSPSIQYTVTSVSGTTVNLSDNAISDSPSIPGDPNDVFSFYKDITVLWDWAPTGHGGDTILLNIKTNEIGTVNRDLILSTSEDPPVAPIVGGSTNPDLGNFSKLNNNYKGIELKFIRQDGSYTTAKVKYFSGWFGGTPNTSPPVPPNYFIDGNIYTGNSTDKVLIKLDRDLSKTNIKLPYFNCFSFGNGVESDRIRDDFNAVKLDKGVKASTVLDEPYEEEQRTNGLIYSGLYNSMSGVNNLNQFIAGEKITKDINPSYGSIQKLKERDTDLVTFCEDKVLKIQANKDALYNADGNTNVVASSSVLGTATSFAGEFGISKNPESFAEESFRLYFTDKQRGKVLRLSGNGITPISSVGMKDYFADNLKQNNILIGSFDDRKEEYNLTLKDQGVTVAFSEGAKGWTSFKSFIQDGGLSLNNDYYTLKNGDLWKHHANETRNNFYDTQYDSHVDVLFNEESEKVKSFGSMKYEGSQAKITQNLLDEEYYNNEDTSTIAGFSGKQGWYVEYGETDLQLAGTMEFKDKEGKWFSYMKGVPVESVKDLNSEEFSFQGIDILNPQLDGCTDRAALNFCPSCTTDDGSCIYSRWYCYDYNCFEDNDGSSLYATEIECQANCIQGSPIYGCTDPAAVNYDPTATNDNGSCCYIYGCMDSTATNYNPSADCDDGSCVSIPTSNPCESIFSVAPGTWDNGSIIASQYTVTPGWSVVGMVYTCRVNITVNAAIDAPYTFELKDASGSYIADNNNQLQPTGIQGSSLTWVVPCNELLSLDVTSNQGCTYNQNIGPINTN